jgi:Ca2+-transporting ATPase
VAVNVFILGEAAYLFNSRSLTRSPFTLGLFSNPWVNRGVAFMLAMQMLLTYAPFMNTLFSTAPIGLREWGLILASALLVFLVVEAEKRLRRKADG